MLAAERWVAALKRASVRLYVAYLVAVVTILGSGLGAVQLEAGLDIRPGADEYNLPAWELRHFGNRLLFDLGARFRDAPGEDEQNDLVRRFLSLTGEINDLERRLSDASQRGQPDDPAETSRLVGLHAERDAIENRVESVIEGRVSAVLADEGIERSLPLFGRFVWPPVDFEPTESPRNLVISRRDRIELLDSDLLREDLSLDEVERVEEATERQRDVSALSFPTGGIGAYPTLVQYTTSYDGLLRLVAHEWTHNYLAFSPLGFNYYRSSQLRAINETVADLVGTEIAREVAARWPVDVPAPPSTPAPATSSAQEQRQRIDVIAELRALRTSVDELLAAGKIDEAEALMEQRRQYLADNGYYIRKINQAYFAFTNLYAGEAGNPSATNPIGPKIDELRRRAGSLRGFVERIQGVTSVAGLDRALERAPAAP